MRAALLAKRDEVRGHIVHEALMNNDLDSHAPLITPVQDTSGSAKRQKVRAGRDAWWHTLKHQAVREGWPRT